MKKEIFSPHSVKIMYHREFVSRIYKEFIIKIFFNGQIIWRAVSSKMIHKCANMKRRSTLLVIKQNQNHKITILISKNQKDNKYWQRCREIRTLTLVGLGNGKVTLVVRFLKKLNTELHTIQPFNPSYIYLHKTFTENLLCGHS